MGTDIFVIVGSDTLKNGYISEYILDRNHILAAMFILQYPQKLHKLLNLSISVKI